MTTVSDRLHLGRELEDARYPNDCIRPEVLSAETREVEWSDEHPLNYGRTFAAAVKELFE